MMMMVVVMMVMVVVMMMMLNEMTAKISLPGSRAAPKPRLVLRGRQLHLLHEVVDRPPPQTSPLQRCHQ